MFPISAKWRNMIVDKGSFHKTFPFLHKYILEDHQSAKIVLFQKVYGLDNFFRCNLQKKFSPICLAQFFSDFCNYDCFVFKNHLQFSSQSQLSAWHLMWDFALDYYENSRSCRCLGCGELAWKFQIRIVWVLALRCSMLTPRVNLSGKII